jgi:hypothetical protein
MKEKVYAKVESFNGQDFLIMPLSSENEILSMDTNGEDPYVPTVGSNEKIAISLKNAVKLIAVDFAKELKSITDEIKPNSVELQFSLGFSQECKLWVIGAKGEQKITVTLTW